MSDSPYNMSYQEMINKIIQELPIPAGQGWVTLDELMNLARQLDGNTERPND